MRIYKFVLFEFETCREKKTKKLGHCNLTIALSRWALIRPTIVCISDSAKLI